MGKNNIVRLPKYFNGKGNLENREYLIQCRKGVICLLAVHDEYCNYYYEVAVITHFISYDDEKRYERYPNDNKEGYLLWKFDEKSDAEEFYKFLVK